MNASDFTRLSRIHLGLVVAVVSIVVVASSGPAHAKAPAKIPAVGDKAPDFSLMDLEGKAVSLATLNADSPVVLVVLRGYPGYQCPICSIQVGGLVSRAADLQQAHAKVVMVYPGPAENLEQRAKEFLKGKSLPDNFVYVTDPDYKFTEAYGLRWNAPRETAYPSTFVIDRQGTVRFAKVSKTHGDRSKPAEIIEALSAAN